MATDVTAHHCWSPVDVLVPRMISINKYSSKCLVNHLLDVQNDDNLEIWMEPMDMSLLLLFLLF